MIMSNGFKNLSGKSKSLLDRVSVNKGVSEMAGMSMPHDTGAFGNIMPHPKKSKSLMPQDINDEKNLGEQKAELYSKLANDAQFVADRQRRYSDEAEEEKEFSEKDKQEAEEKGQIARQMDDEQELELDDEFVDYRDDVADIFEERAKKLKNFQKTAHLMMALQKLDSQGEEGINAGFGHQEKVFDKDGKVIEDKTHISDKDQSLYVPEDIENEKGLVYKASYENPTEGQSWTDEKTPVEDSFYLPTKISNETNDNDKNAKKKKKEADKAQREYFGKVPDNESDQGKARVNQNYNVGTIENAQIGNQGGVGGKGV
jgi:hypothetical protein